MIGGVRPVGGGQTARQQLDAHEVDDRSDGSLGNAIELVNVRRTRGLRDEISVQQFFELVGEELARVVRV